jgi:PIN domain nuclease of toxin-antitoxin system
MKILLDTHIFLWYISGDKQLPAFMVEQIRHPANKVYLSVVSLWEVIIKYQLGRLPLPNSPEIYLPQQRRRHLIENLNVDEKSVRQLITLPLLHNDPFDRLLISQAIKHEMILATVDVQILAYPVNTLKRFDSEQAAE